MSGVAVVAGNVDIEDVVGAGHPVETQTRVWEDVAVGMSPRICDPMEDWHQYCSHDRVGCQVQFLVVCMSSENYGLHGRFLFYLRIRSEVGRIDVRRL